MSQQASPKNTAMAILLPTNIDELDDREKRHSCDLAWDRPNGQTRSGQCDDFDAFSRTAIGTLLCVALYEMTYNSTVGPDSSLGEQITNVINADNTPPPFADTAWSIQRRTTTQSQRISIWTATRGWRLMPV